MDIHQKNKEAKTQAQILLMRFGLNTLLRILIITRELAKGIGAAVAGWWTAGAGIPIISNLIICAWEWEKQYLIQRFKGRKGCSVVC